MDLPIGNEPLTLADGTQIDCESGKVIKTTAAKFISVPSPSEAQKIIARTRKTVAELPMPPEKLSVVALVEFYTLYGLDKREISIALDGKITEDQIENIRKLDAYIDFMQVAKENMLNTETQHVRDVFEKHAPIAAQKIVELAQSDVEVLAFKASQDVLDRAGHRPTDIVEHRHKMEDSLNIVITKRDETVPVPTIDIRPERIEE
jgi:peroxiredoxin family protein